MGAPLIWVNGQLVEGTHEKFCKQLRAVADRIDKRLNIFSDERSLVGDYLRRAADEIQLLKLQLNQREGE